MGRRFLYQGKPKKNASIILNDVFKVTGIRIGISQKGNVFVSMPDYKTGRLDDNGIIFRKYFYILAEQWNNGNRKNY